MHIAVMSDSHDQIWNMRKAISSIMEHDIQTIIHCGDLISPFMLEEFEGFQGTIHICAGNNPGDQALLMEKIQEATCKVVYHGIFGRLRLAGKDIAFVHDPGIAHAIARSDEFDICLFGHTHRWYIETIKGTLLLNPGEILGKKEAPGWARLDLTTNSVQRILI